MKLNNLKPAEGAVKARKRIGRGTGSGRGGTGAPVAVMGLILPLYAVIDMVETAVNVWSDSCVCAMVDRDLDA